MNRRIKVISEVTSRKVFSACMCLMMLTSVMPNMPGVGNYANAKCCNTMPSRTTGNKQNFINKLRQIFSQFSNKIGLRTSLNTGNIKSCLKNNKSIKYEKLLHVAGIFCDFYAKGVYGELINWTLDDEIRNPESDVINPDLVSLLNELEVFAKIEGFKYNADIANLKTNVDVTEFKTKLHKIAHEIDFKNFDETSYEKKLDEISNAQPEYEKYMLYGANSEFEELLKTDLKSKLTNEDKVDILKLFKKKVDVTETHFEKLFMGNEEYKLNIKIYAAMNFACDILGFDMKEKSDCQTLLEIMDVSKQDIDEYISKEFENPKITKIVYCCN